MFTAVKKLDPNHPVDQGILKLVKEGLVNTHFDHESQQVMISLTDLGERIADKLKDVGFLPKPAEELTDEDKELIERFTKNSKKYLDSL